MRVRTTSDQSAHESDILPFTQRQSMLALDLLAIHLVRLRDTHVGRLLCRLSLARQRALVDLEPDGREEPDVGGHAVADSERDQVAWYEGVGQDGLRVSVSANTKGRGASVFETSCNEVQWRTHLIRWQ